MGRLRTAARFAGLGGVLAVAACGGGASPRGDAGLSPDMERAYLWYAGAGLNAYTKQATEATSDDGPAFILVPDLPVRSFHDLVVDGAGNLWAIPISGDRVLRFPAAHLVPGPPPVADLIVTSPGFHNPQSLVFDRGGDLWLLNYDGAGAAVGTIVRLPDPRALTGEQTLAPVATIAPGASADERRLFTRPTNIAFDRFGNLWMAAFASVVRIDRAVRLEGDVVAAPSAVIASGDAYAAIAFDAYDALWITGARSGYFVRRIASPDALAGAVNPPPAANLRLPTDSALFAGGMAFDAGGALWIAMSDRIIKLAGASETSGDAQATPAVTLATSLSPDLTSKLVIYPRPPALPIY